MEQPLVSIAIPTFNQGPYILDCLKSIQEQTYKNFEVIIQDSNSSDQTEDICRTFSMADSRFKYFREKDQGQSDAINRSLQRSGGKYWTWICSDDFYQSITAVAELVERLEKKTKEAPNLVGVFGRAVYVADNGSYLGDYFTFTEKVEQKTFQRMWPFSQPSSLLKIEAVKNAGGVVKELHLGMDLDLFIKMTAGGKYFEFVPQYVAAVRIQENSKSVMLRMKTAENALSLLRTHFGSVGTPWNSAYVQEYANARTEEHIRALRSGFLGSLLGGVVDKQEAPSFSDASNGKTKLSPMVRLKKALKSVLHFGHRLSAVRKVCL